MRLPVAGAGLVATSAGGANSAIFVWATALPIWIKAKRAERLGPGGEASRFEKQLERRVSELEDRHIQQMADMEDQHNRSIAELEERLADGAAG